MPTHAATDLTPSALAALIGPTPVSTLLKVEARADPTRSPPPRIAPSATPPPFHQQKSPPPSKPTAWEREWLSAYERKTPPRVTASAPSLAELNSQPPCRLYFSHTKAVIAASAAARRADREALSEAPPAITRAERLRARQLVASTLITPRASRIAARLASAPYFPSAINDLRPPAESGTASPGAAACAAASFASPSRRAPRADAAAADRGVASGFGGAAPRFLVRAGTAEAFRHVCGYTGGAGRM